MPKISVIITCYNYGQFIEEAVDSVLSQTFKDFEVIIVNDGSTDEHTIEVLNRIRKEHPEFTMIDHENSGAAAAKNSGIRVAKGEFFLPLDADDKIDPKMLEECLGVIKRDDKLGFVYTDTKFFENFNAVLPRQEYDFHNLLQRNYVVVSSLIRKTAWEEVGGYDETMRNGYEDWEFFIHLGKKGWFGKVIKEPLFLYREHGNSKNKEATKKHALIFEYIRGKHADLYNEKRMEEIKKEWKKNISFQYLNLEYYVRSFKRALFIKKRYGLKNMLVRSLGFRR